MSLTVQNYRVLYNANGVQTSFAIPQSFFSDNDNIVVLDVDDSSDPVVEDLQVEGVDYSIVGTNVVFGAAPANGHIVGIFREMDIEQALDLIASGPFNVDSLETQLDKMVAIMQQLNGMISRAVKLRKSTSLLDTAFPDPQPLFVIRWNAAGTALEAVDGSGLGGGSAAIDVVGEEPTGAINNSNLIFNLANEPDANTLKVFQNGRRTLDFTLLGQVLTLGTAPGFGGEVAVDYSYTV